MTISERLSKYMAHESPHVQNRAKIVLMTLDGKSVEEIIAELGLSQKTVQRWQNAWDREGMSIFPEMEQEILSIKDIVETQDSEVVAEETEQNCGNVLHGLEFPEIPPLLAINSMAEAGRKLLLSQLQQMVEQEPIAREGQDIEGVHQMRVATRRWRSSYDGLGDYLPKPYRKGIYNNLRRTARHLGKVRDLDVFLLKAHKYSQSELDKDGIALEILIQMIKKDRQKAKKQLSRWFDNKKYKQFIQRAFNLLSQSDESDTLIFKNGQLISTRLDHMLPAMIYQRLEALRRYEELLPNAPIATLHELRKDGKRLRYTLELFADVLGKEVQIVIDGTKMLQDHLGDLNDAEIAVAMIRAAEKQVKKSERAAFKAYGNYRQAEIKRLYDTFPEIWSQFNQADIRYALAQAVAVL